MAIFSYRATTMEGAIVEGAIEAADEKSAIERLKNSGIIPLKVAAQGYPWTEVSTPSRRYLKVRI